jgi:hypothetical protein
VAFDSRVNYTRASEIDEPIEAASTKSQEEESRNVLAMAFPGSEAMFNEIFHGTRSIRETGSQDEEEGRELA